MVVIYNLDGTVDFLATREVFLGEFHGDFLADEDYTEEEPDDGAG